MTKKLTWEVEKTSLVLKVTDGAKETTWKLRKNQGSGIWTKIFSEVLNPLWETGPAPWDDEPIQPTRPMYEPGCTVDAEELAELQRYEAVQAESEEASRAAQAREVTCDMIAQRAYEIYCSGAGGSQDDNWFRAERELRQTQGV